MKPTILVVDDKPNMTAMLSKVLGKLGRVVTARGVRSALEALEREPITVVLCDLRMSDGDGLEVLRAVRARWPGVPFILMTAYATVPTAVQAMREGAYDYVTKPFETDALKALVERALAQAAVLHETHEPRDVDGFGAMIGRSPAMRRIYQLIERVAPTDATVLILGETGTGKELVARAIHERSSRAPSRLVAVNCAAIPRSLIESELFGHARGSFTGAVADRAGLFEEAHESTLFLDEIGELRPTLQAKLTRVLEERSVRRIGEPRERKVDVRVIAATHRDVRGMVKAGSFREDLWFRLNVCVLELPPLRERAEDIPLLAQRFLAERAPHAGSSATRFSEAALSALSAYRWPGNVRELRSAVERAAIIETTREITLCSLPPEIQGANAAAATGARDTELAKLTYREAVDASRAEASRRYLEAVLKRFFGDVTAAAEHAGIERESFYRLMRRAGLSAEEFRK
ncbi:sigma-54 dependent transcriptional regulator [Polyangium sp. y55x31]|uniref:sigma-54-dependent transcriptional regulator n=1 Tax=Polyangium sp. y55x31 TaxID=3042688 RepID=UPI002482DC16|nr:sigma-54 dependent transcriptional regulator [Polyangium sp. y55x31]MDI1481243.1 sigma-54 dependent transcriptional regulator [Polyangium sp. y55x31]